MILLSYFNDHIVQQLCRSSYGGSVAYCPLLRLVLRPSTTAVDRDPRFNHLSRTPTCDGQTDRQTDKRTDRWTDTQW